MNIDWPTLINWIIEGLIALVLGIIGGFIGSWIKYHFDNRREADKEKKEIRAKLLKGVNEYVENTRRITVDDLDIPTFQRSLLPKDRKIKIPGSILIISFLIFAILWFYRYPPVGIAFIFIIGLLFGYRQK